MVGLTISYMMRVNVSMAVTVLADDLGWSDTEKGVLLSSFFWGYAIGQVPWSIMTLSFSPSFLYGVGVIIPSVLTILFPMVCSYSFHGAVYMQLFNGLASGALFPSLFRFFPAWIPFNERPFIVSLITSGIYIVSLCACIIYCFVISLHLM